MWETWVQSLGWEDPLEEGMETHSSFLAWRIPMDRGAWQATVHGVTKSETSLKQHSTISHPYTAIGKTIALTIWTFVGNVMSLLFSTLSRFVIVFLPRSKHLLISWLQSPSAVILEPKKITPWLVVLL